MCRRAEVPPSAAVVGSVVQAAPEPLGALKVQGLLPVSKLPLTTTFGPGGGIGVAVGRGVPGACPMRASTLAVMPCMRLSSPGMFPYVKLSRLLTQLIVPASKTTAPLEAV